MNNPQEIELKPCPFCGSGAVVNPAKMVHGDTWFVATCSDYRCPVALSPINDEDDAIKAWNTRTSPSIEELTGVIVNALIDTYPLGHAPVLAVHQKAPHVVECVLNLLNGEGNDE